MEKYLCPICGRAHCVVPYYCECGYYEDKVRNYDDENTYLFAIYKFSKLIFNKQIEWKQSNFDFMEYGSGIVYIQEIFEKNAIAYVDLDLQDKRTGVEAGVLAFKRNVKSLIINANVINHEMLDESGVRMLFLGNKVDDLTCFINLSLKYIEVSKDNPYFTSKNNVLFNKDMTRLIYYCSMKPEEEYVIPKSVKVVADWAFIGIHPTLGLKTIHCSKKVKFEDPHCSPSPYSHIKIIYDQD